MVDVHQSPGTFHRERRDPSSDGSGDLSVLVSPRLIREEDIPWVYHLSIRKYPKFDAVTAEGWLRNNVLKSPLMFLAQRTEHAFCVSMLTVAPWYPADFACDVVFICAEDDHMWDAVKLMRASVEWARSRKCVVWRLSSDTDKDLMVLARRVGAIEISPRFALSLK